MKTIFILIDQLHSHGGIEKLVAQKANYWSGVFGYKVKIISTEQEDKLLVYGLSDQVMFQDLSIGYHREISFFHPKNLGKLLKNILHLKKIIKDEKPDIILVASHIPMTYLLPFIGTKAKIIKEFHYSKYNQSTGLKERIFNNIENYYDGLVVLSKEEASFYKSNNTIVIPNPVKIPEHEIRKISERENIAMAVLRFAPVKQLEKMVHIWEKFSKKNGNWKLYLYGEKEGVYFRKIEQLVLKKNLETKIVFKGKTNDVYAELMNAKLLLLTSEQECFPMVILEANACGVPVISFDSPTGPRNIIHNNIDGILVESNMEDDFVNHLVNLTQNEQEIQRLSEAALLNAKDYDLQKVMNLWKSLIFEK